MFFSEMCNALKMKTLVSTWLIMFGVCLYCFSGLKSESLSPFPPTWASFGPAPLHSTAAWSLWPGDEVHLYVGGNHEYYVSKRILKKTTFKHLLSHKNKMFSYCWHSGWLQLDRGTLSPEPSGRSPLRPRRLTNTRSFVWGHWRAKQLSLTVTNIVCKHFPDS